MNLSIDNSITKCTKDPLVSLDHLEREDHEAPKEWKALLAHLGQKDSKV